MNLSLVIWILMSLGLFWCVGLYNRIVRIRTRAEDAFRSVVKHMQHCASLGSQLQAQSLPQSDNWVQMVNCSLLLEQQLQLTASSPFALNTVARLGASFDNLHTQWECIFRIPIDLAGPAVPAPLLALWEQNATRVSISRNGLNQILFKYNEAIAQFPASLLVRMMRFKPSEPL
jgi:LemA protein